ncbi:ABC transporter substrate-binding protein [Saccharothrix australiensis]|uniref:Iron complex transport system substrate-binding protein n=1 Tax=Saccharothrix australiensis TaxID=2072 RepID=A0A495W5C5_9PSEU|nr:ABC transporter substrate-binding protein [Saccharothrix australiensis]RKT55863.1 iron complex transport system substrate-binding protein [Saccharothrix australiensis]
MRTLALVAAAAVAACAAACNTAPAEETPSATPIVRTAAPLEPALSVTDPRGARITLPEPAERIVCLNGLCDDLVADLGLTPVGTSNAALITHPALLGAAGEAVPVVPGTFGGEDVEAIAGFRPDLVIGLPGVHDALRPAIEKFAPLWTAEPATWEESVGYLRALGALTGRTDQAVRAEERFRAHLADAVGKTHANGQSARKVLLMYGSVDSIGVDTTASLKGHLLGQLFGYPFPAKGSDVDTANNYSVEELLAKQPDVIFVYSLLFAAEDRTLSSRLADNPVWRQIPAVQQQRVHEMHAKLWGSGRGLRSLTAVVDEAVAKVPA